MTAEPNPPPRPVAEWVAAHRKPVAVALLVVAVAFLAVAGYCLLKVANESAVPAPTAADDAPFPAPPSAYRTVYLWGGIIGLALAAVSSVLGAGYLTRLPSAEPARNRHAAGVLILLAGSLIGFLLLLFGTVLFRLWFDALVKWVDVRDASEAWKPLTALLVLLAGAGLMFVAAQPARADERNHPSIRRAVYGINFGLTVVLMVFGLVALNVIVAMKVPAKLDTTQNQSYTLTDATKAYLAGLTQTVQATATFTPELVSDNPESNRIATDLRRLLEACQEVNPQQFKVRNIHPVLDQAELAKIQQQHPQPGLILEIAGQSEFIRASELTDGQAFRGEGEVVKRLLFLTEDRDRAVYFTQGHGEPAVAPSPDRKVAGRTGRQLAEVLERSNTEVKSLLFDPVTPVVPDDASVLIIIDPHTAFTPTEVAAVRAYMNKPRSNGKKGKLVVAAGPVPKADKTGVLDTGLDPLLAEFGVSPNNRYLMGERRGPLDFGDFVVYPEAGAARAEHPVAMALAEGALFPNCRILNPAEGGPYTANPIGFSVPEQRATWFETEPPTNPQELFAGIRASAEIRRLKQLTGNGQWPLVVTVTEPGPPPSKPGEQPKDISRLVAFGSGDAFADPTREGGGGGNATLLASAVDWLRERPAVAAVAAKPYGVYKPLRGVDNTKLLWLPVGITLLSVVALGLGVWSYRRK